MKQMFGQPPLPHLTTPIMRLTTMVWGLVLGAIGLAYTFQANSRAAAPSFSLQKEWGAHLDAGMPLRPWGVALLVVVVMLLVSAVANLSWLGATGCFLAAFIVGLGCAGVVVAVVEHDASWSTPFFYVALYLSLLYHGTLLTRDAARHGRA